MAPPPGSKGTEPNKEKQPFSPNVAKGKDKLPEGGAGAPPATIEMTDLQPAPVGAVLNVDGVQPKAGAADGHEGKKRSKLSKLNKAAGAFHGKERRLRARQKQTPGISDIEILDRATREHHGKIEQLSELAESVDPKKHLPSKNRHSEWGAKVELYLELIEKPMTDRKTLIQNIRRLVGIGGEAWGRARHLQENCFVNSMNEPVFTWTTQCVATGFRPDRVKGLRSDEEWYNLEAMQHDDDVEFDSIFQRRLRNCIDQRKTEVMAKIREFRLQAQTCVFIIMEVLANLFKASLRIKELSLVKGKWREVMEFILRNIFVGFLMHGPTKETAPKFIWLLFHPKHNRETEGDVFELREMVAASFLSYGHRWSVDRLLLFYMYAEGKRHLQYEEEEEGESSTTIEDMNEITMGAYRRIGRQVHPFFPVLDPYDEDEDEYKPIVMVLAHHGYYPEIRQQLSTLESDSNIEKRIYTYQMPWWQDKRLWDSKYGNLDRHDFERVNDPRLQAEILREDGGDVKAHENLVEIMRSANIEVLTHPAMEALISTLWPFFGRNQVWQGMILHTLLVSFFTTSVLILVDTTSDADNEHYKNFGSFCGLVACILAVVHLVMEGMEFIKEFSTAKKKQKTREEIDKEAASRELAKIVDGNFARQAKLYLPYPSTISHMFSVLNEAWLTQVMRVNIEKRQEKREYKKLMKEMKEEDELRRKKRQETADARAGLAAADDEKGEAAAAAVSKPSPSPQGEAMSARPSMDLDEGFESEYGDDGFDDERPNRIKEACKAVDRFLKKNFSRVFFLPRNTFRFCSHIHGRVVRYMFPLMQDGFTLPDADGGGSRSRGAARNLANMADPPRVGPKTVLMYNCIVLLARYVYHKVDDKLEQKIEDIQASEGITSKRQKTFTNLHDHLKAEEARLQAEMAEGSSNGGAEKAPKKGKKVSMADDVKGDPEINERASMADTKSNWTSDLSMKATPFVLLRWFWAMAYMKYVWAVINIFKLPPYARHLENYIELVSHLGVFMLAPTIYNSKYFDENSSEFRHMLAAIVLLLWVRFLQFMDFRSEFGLMSRVIVRMMKDASGFMVFMGAFLFMYSISFYILLSDSDIDEFATIDESFMSMFRFGILGDIEYDSVKDYVMAKILYVSFAILVVVLALNFLIAIMSNSYENVNSNAEKEVIMRRAHIIGKSMMLQSDKKGSERLRVKIKKILGPRWKRPISAAESSLSQSEEAELEKEKIMRMTLNAVGEMKPTVSATNGSVKNTEERLQTANETISKVETKVKEMYSKNIEFEKSLKHAQTEAHTTMVKKLSELETTIQSKVDVSIQSLKAEVNKSVTDQLSALTQLVKSQSEETKQALSSLMAQAKAASAAPSAVPAAAPQSSAPSPQTTASATPKPGAAQPGAAAPTTSGATGSTATRPAGASPSPKSPSPSAPPGSRPGMTPATPPAAGRAGPTAPPVGRPGPGPPVSRPPGPPGVGRGGPPGPPPPGRR